MFEEYQPFPIRDFGGLWKRGKADTCPSNHFQDCSNVVFGEASVKTRNGIEQVLASGAVLRTHSYKRINEAERTLILKAGGNLYDSVNLGVPILTIAAMTDFSALNLYNRVYISPHNGLKGLANEKIYVWDGTTLRAAAGVAPSAAITAVQSATSGNIEAGTHLYGIVFESASGYLSKPGPTSFGVVVSDGTHKVDISGIAAGPVGTVRRHIIATRAIATYDGNQFGQEWFFIPDGVINNNVDTTISVNFYDSQLSEDALYLFDVLTEIPAGLVLGHYKGRMIVANFDDNQFMARLSERNEPEIFDDANSALIVGPQDAKGITNVVEHRDLLGLTKSMMSYVTSDNGDNPSTWEVISLDPGIGTEVHGISAILDKSGTSTDRFFIASRGGLIMFDGSFKQPELSWKIEDLWLRINQDNFHKTVVAYDPVNKLIYCLVPLDAATSPSHIFYADCNEGLDYKKIKWSVWEFPNAPTSIFIGILNNTPVLNIGSDNIYRIAVGRTNDNNIAINNYVKLGLIPEKSNGMINHFSFLQMRISGAGSVAPQLSGIDDTGIVNPPNFVLSAAPGTEVVRKINYVKERMSVKFTLSSIDEIFEMNSITAYYKALWSQRPA